MPKAVPNKIMDKRPDAGGVGDGLIKRLLRETGTNAARSRVDYRIIVSGAGAVGTGRLGVSRETMNRPGTPPLDAVTNKMIQVRPRLHARRRLQMSPGASTVERDNLRR